MEITTAVKSFLTQEWPTVVQGDFHARNWRKGGSGDPPDKKQRFRQICTLHPNF